MAAEPRILTTEQSFIGQLPWVEATRSESPRDAAPWRDEPNNPRLKFARVDLNLFPFPMQYELEGILADNGIVATRPPQGGYLQVPLGETSGKNLDVLRLAAVDWKNTPADGQVLMADANQLHSHEFLKNTQFNAKVNPETVLQGLQQLHARYGVTTSVQAAADGTFRLEVPMDQSAKLAEIRALPVSLDNLPYDYKIEEAKARQLAESKPSTGTRAMTGAAFGVVASIPAIVETYQIAKEEVNSGKAPVGAANFATKAAAEITAASIAGGTAAVAATPLLAIPPPAGEIAYGAAVLGAGYLGAEGTRKLMEQADYYLLKAESYFQDNKAKASFEGQVRENAKNNGQDPEVAVVLSYKMIDDQAKQVSSKATEQSTLPAAQGAER